MFGYARSLMQSVGFLSCGKRGLLFIGVHGLLIGFSY